MHCEDFKAWLESVQVDSVWERKLQLAHNNIFGI